MIKWAEDELGAKTNLKWDVFARGEIQNKLISCLANTARWSGVVIWRTGKKNFNAVSHNRARPYWCCFQTPCSISIAKTQQIISCYWKNIQVDPTSSNLASAMLNSKIRPRAVVRYSVKIFHPSPPNYVTRSPGVINIILITKLWSIIIVLRESWPQVFIQTSFPGPWLCTSNFSQDSPIHT